MRTPILKIDLNKLIINLNTIKKLCNDRELKLTVVTKVLEGYAPVVSEFVKKINSIGDSRICDIEEMVSNNIKADYMLIRSPSFSEIPDVVKYCNVSLNTEIGTLNRLGENSDINKKRHKVILMIEIGDLREGIPIDEFENFLKEATKIKGIELIGVGANSTCFAGIIPSEKTLSILERAANTFKKTIGINPIVSGGGSNLIPLILNNKLPGFINHIRIGEAIMLGVDAINKNRIPDCYTDCFTLISEIIEIKEKPSITEGEFAPNAFGEHPIFENKGIRKKALLNIGRLDTDILGIKPKIKGITILGATSDHLIADIEEAEQFSNGDLIEFDLNYSALLYAMNSNYVAKIVVNSPSVK
jgi:ornithine racemase